MNNGNFKVINETQLREATAELLDAVQNFREHLENMPDEEFFKTRPDLIQILESFRNWMENQSRTSNEIYQICTTYDPSLLKDKDREFWLNDLEKLEFDIRCSQLTTKG